MAGVNSNFMVLLPKLENANTIDQFHLIMLNNFLFEIIMKVMANRLAGVANKIISENKFGFIWGCYIKDCSVSNSECLIISDKKCFWG